MAQQKQNKKTQIYQQMLKRNEALSKSGEVEKMLQEMNQNTDKIKNLDENINVWESKRTESHNELVELYKKRNKAINNPSQKWTKADDERIEALKKNIANIQLNQTTLANEKVKLQEWNDQTKQDLQLAYTIEEKDGKFDVKRDADGKIDAKPAYTEQQLTVIEKLSRGEKVDAAELKLLDTNHSDRLYSQMRDAWIEQSSSGYEYNIAKGKYEKLFDVRNYMNFRSTFTPNYTKNNNFTESIAGGGTAASRSFYMSKNDFLWSENFNLLYDENGNQLIKNSVQNIILNEYQPIFQFSLQNEIVNLGVGVLQGLANELTGDDDNKKAQATLANTGVKFVLSQFSNQKLYDFAKNPGELYNEQKYTEKTNPMYWVKHMFNDGQWLNTYQLPFVYDGKMINQYLETSQNAGNWAVGGLINNNTFGNLGQTMTEAGITLSVPAVPTFSIENPSNATRSVIDLSFYLINKNDEWLGKNYEFMHALFAGSQWLFMTCGMVVGSNVYHVLVPGRFMIDWAYIKTSWDAVGKLRTNDYMYSRYAAEKNAGGYNIKSIQKDTLWPEAWKVSISIHPLTPLNLNTYLDYHVNGFGEKQKEMLRNLQGNLLTGKAPGVFSDTNKHEINLTDIKGEITQDNIAAAEELHKKIITLARNGDNLEKEDLQLLDQLEKKLNTYTAEVEYKVDQAFTNSWEDWKRTHANASVQEAQAAKKALDLQRQKELEKITENSNYSKLKGRINGIHGFQKQADEVAAQDTKDYVIASMMGGATAVAGTYIYKKITR